MDRELVGKLGRLRFGSLEMIAPVVLQFASGDQANTGEIFTIKCGRKRVSFLVVPKCSSPCLLGRANLKIIFPDLLPRLLGGDAVEMINVGRAMREEGEDWYIVPNDNAFANAHVLPYTAPERKRSPTDKALVALCVGRMEESGVVEKCGPGNVALSQEIVSVDKYEAKQWLRVYPPRPEDEKRWRVTLAASRSTH
jgi:hypothetical protein